VSYEISHAKSHHYQRVEEVCQVNKIHIFAALQTAILNLSLQK